MSGSLDSPLARPDERLETDSRVGTVLAERYRIDSLLGEGGMGRVYAAEHVLMRKRLAIKVLHRELTSVPEVVARFEREAMAAANIDHPNVAAATDFGKLVDGAVFLVLEYVQGENLRDEIAKGPMAIERALHVGRQIASALGSAHALDIVHRDLKPENVMLVEKGGDPDFVKVLDFGIAKVPIGEVGPGGEAHRPITKVGMVFGTPEYMAPEQALGQAVDGRADLYALGVILFEMLAGVRPFSSKSQVGILGQQLSKPPPRFAERAPGIFVPPHVEQIVLKLLEKEASDRFQTATDVVDVLDALLGPAPSLSGRKLTLANGSPAAFGSQPWLTPGSVPDLRASGPVSSHSWSDGTIPVSGSVPDGLPIGTVPLGQPAPVQGVPSARVSLASMGASVSGAFDAVVNPERGTPLERLYAWIERRRAALPDAVRKPLQGVPPAAFLGGAVLLLAGTAFLFVIAIVALVGHKSVETPAVAATSSSAPLASAVAPPTAAPAPEVAVARKKGSSALADVAARYPKDAKLQIEMAKAYLLERKHPEAVGAVGRALALDSSLAQSPDVASTLWVTAQSKESADSAFALLEGPMGTKGADILYDLVTTEGIVRSVKQRAEQWLKTQQFQKNSSPALNVAVALRFAKECSQRYALLLRAKNVGDKRSLKYLRQYQSHTGCGRHGRTDCQPCMRKDSRLEDAINEIEKRDHS